MWDADPRPFNPQTEQIFWLLKSVTLTEAAQCRPRALLVSSHHRMGRGSNHGGTLGQSGPTQASFPPHSCGVHPSRSIGTGTAWPPVPTPYPEGQHLHTEKGLAFFSNWAQNPSDDMGLQTRFGNELKRQCNSHGTGHTGLRLTLSAGLLPGRAVAQHTPGPTYRTRTGSTGCSPPPSLHTCLRPFQCR